MGYPYKVSGKVQYDGRSSMFFLMQFNSDAAYDPSTAKDLEDGVWAALNAKAHCLFITGRGELSQPMNPDYDTDDSPRLFELSLHYDGTVPNHSSRFNVYRAKSPTAGMPLKPAATLLDLEQLASSLLAVADSNGCNFLPVRARGDIEAVAFAANRSSYNGRFAVANIDG